MLNIARVKIDVHVDESRIRPADVPVLVGDNSKITSLGWIKKIPIEQSLENILNYWREIILNNEVFRRSNTVR
jgi:GDP-4-dehydro-6-deoxy-D-mannose reductase